MRHAATLTLRGIACARGGRTLFEGLDLDLPPGGALRLLGPNGSGKTSLLRLLAGLLPPAEGAVALEGAGDGPMRLRVHLLSHLDAIKPSLTVSGALAFWCAYLGGGAARETDAILSRVGLDQLAGARCGDLSAGQRRRLALARVIAVPRPLWLLDEPTAALDAEGQGLLERVIAAHRAEGGLVVAATHLPLDLPGARTLRLDVAA